VGDRTPSGGQGFGALEVEVHLRLEVQATPHPVGDAIIERVVLVLVDGEGEVPVARLVILVEQDPQPGQLAGPNRVWCP
jgi:hypothetical protein